MLLLRLLKVAVRACATHTLYGGLMLKWMRYQSMAVRYFFERLCFMALQAAPD